MSIDIERSIFGLKKERYDELVEDYGKEYADNYADGYEIGYAISSVSSHARLYEFYRDNAVKLIISKIDSGKFGSREWNVEEMDDDLRKCIIDELSKRKERYESLIEDS
ncbi:MAG: hypothetical protein IJT54_03845 [Candidatus Methanomethylophilaceae archaeon]|nr:hypothetical protein [Candidatus Methanomethylophilaceae archaeon]